MLELRHRTGPAWVTCVLEAFDAFLQDHAANERKVATSALDLAAKHPRRATLVKAMVAVALEELRHFRDVHRLLRSRGQHLIDDQPDPYMGAARHLLRAKPDVKVLLLDKLCLFAIIEARGHERFSLLAEALQDERLRRFYTSLARGEERHSSTYLELARRYYDEASVDARLDALLDAEAAIVRELPVRPALFSGSP